jgi:hypothetical protein
MDAAEGSKSKKDNQVVFLNWKLAKPRMRFRDWLGQSGAAPRKHFVQNTNDLYPVPRSFWSATRPRVLLLLDHWTLSGIWNLDFGFRWTGIEISREN